jgi:hypothetical protein
MTVAVVFGGSVASVRAVDIRPPPWTRGSANTTYQSWSFSTSASPLGPDLGVFNPYGTPAATITGGSWLSIYDNRFGLWNLDSSSSMDFRIPNTPADPTRQKNVWTQITWQDNGATPVVTVDGYASLLVTNVQVGTGSWFDSVYETTLPYNPAAEDVIISAAGGTIHVDQVVIDTICIPEPSSLALLAMGVISLLPYASRKRRLAA